MLVLGNIVYIREFINYSIIFILYKNEIDKFFNIVTNKKIMVDLNPEEK